MGVDEPCGEGVVMPIHDASLVTAKVFYTCITPDINDAIPSNCHGFCEWICIVPCKYSRMSDDDISRFQR